LLLAQHTTKAVGVNAVVVTLGTEEGHGTQRMQSARMSEITSIIKIIGRKETNINNNGGVEPLFVL